MVLEASPQGNLRAGRPCHGTGVTSVLEHTGTAGEKEDLKATLLHLLPCSSLERQLRTRNTTMLVVAPTAYLGCSCNDHGIHIGILQCTLLDDKADGIGNSISTHRVPCLLGRFLVGNPSETLCRRIEAFHRPGGLSDSVPGE